MLAATQRHRNAPEIRSQPTGSQAGDGQALDVGAVGWRGPGSGVGQRGCPSRLRLAIRGRAARPFVFFTCKTGLLPVRASEGGCEHAAWPERPSRPPRGAAVLVTSIVTAVGVATVVLAWSLFFFSFFVTEA